MGHTLADPDLAYQRLQQRLDRMPTGAPDSPVFQQILRLLFTVEEAEIAARMPTVCSVSTLARRTGRTEADLGPMVDTMAAKGLVIDLENHGQRYVALAPVVIGFFEFTFMRVREDAPMEQLAALFHEYMFDDDSFAHAVFRGSTQIGRSLVREEALPEDSHGRSPGLGARDAHRLRGAVGGRLTVPVQDARGADRRGLRQADPHLPHVRRGRRCAGPRRPRRAHQQRGGPRDPGRRRRPRAWRRRPTTSSSGISYICNCCGCCCGMMQSIRRHGITGSIVSSNWVAHVDLDKCRGCKKCFHACPADAITMVNNEGKGLRVNWAIVDPLKCLGCGVCDERCNWGAHSMVPREARVFTPENTFDRMVTMAIERGKLGELLVDTLDGAGPHALARALGILHASRPATAARAIEPLNSVFLRGMLAAVHATSRAAAPVTPV